MDVKERMFSATLTSPIKLDGEMKSAGTPVMVTEGVLKQIEGCVDPLLTKLAFDPDAPAPTPIIAVETAVAAAVARNDASWNGFLEGLRSDHKVEITTAVADREANWSTALDHFETIADDRRLADLAALQAETDARIAAIQKDADARVEAVKAPADPEPAPTKSKAK